jgi:hypothetical protein
VVITFLSYLADDPEAALRSVRELVADVVADIRWIGEKT